MRRQISGFSIVEMMLALGLLAVVILSMALLSMSIVRSSTESNDRTAAAAVARTILDKVGKECQTDPNFWDNDHMVTPYQSTSLKYGKINFEYDVFAETVTDTMGAPIGSALDKNRLKNVSVQLTWFDTKTQQKQGYGKLNFSASRLVSEEGRLP